MSRETLRNSKNIRFFDHGDDVVWRVWLEGKRGEEKDKDRAVRSPIKKVMEHTRKFERLLTNGTLRLGQHAYTMREHRLAYTLHIYRMLCLVHYYLLLITVTWRPQFFWACLADGIGFNVTDRRFGAWPLIHFRTTPPSLVGAITMRRVGDPDTRYENV